MMEPRRSAANDRAAQYQPHGIHAITDQQEEAEHGEFVGILAGKIVCRGWLLVQAGLC